MSPRRRRILLLGVFWSVYAGCIAALLTFLTRPV